MDIAGCIGMNCYHIVVLKIIHNATMAHVQKHGLLGLKSQLALRFMASYKINE